MSMLISPSHKRINNKLKWNSKQFLQLHSWCKSSGPGFEILVNFYSIFSVSDCRREGCDLSQDQIRKPRRDNNTEEKEIVTVSIFHLMKRWKYYISGLPWFSAIQSSQAGHFSRRRSASINLNDHFSDGQRRKLKNFSRSSLPTILLTWITLIWLLRNVDIIANTTFKTIDYIYLKRRSESNRLCSSNLWGREGPLIQKTSGLPSPEKKKTYYVLKLEHTIPLNYANDKE